MHEDSATEQEETSQAQRRSQRIWTLLSFLSGPIAVLCYFGAFYLYETLRGDASGAERLIVSIAIAVALLAVFLWLFFVLKRRLAPPKDYPWTIRRIRQRRRERVATSD